MVVREKTQEKSLPFDSLDGVLSFVSVVENVRLVIVSDLHHGHNLKFRREGEICKFLAERRAHAKILAINARNFCER